MKTACAIFLILVCIHTHAQETDALNQDFKKAVLLKSVLDNCDENEAVKNSKNEWLPFIVSYTQYLAHHEQLDDDTIARIVTNSVIAVDNQFGDSVPENVCLAALEKIQHLEQKINIKELDSGDKK